ncbi:ABC transporter substrate-binding protein [Undibacterium sp. Di27W]|uniref:ABC transporter substrate-binding protein n=1 Tax=Undibacterium sp. Di27W TaxID=3413036 RepID=UPI003BF1685F
MWIYRFTLSLLLSWCLLAPATLMAMTVTFLNPGKSDEVYWVTASNCMMTAARNLGVQLEVIYAERDHLKTLELARQIAARPLNARPDYVILSNDYAVGAEALRILDGAHIKTFFSYSSFSDAGEREKVGAPRQLYKGWLGGLEPRAEDAGYLTASALIQRGRAEKLTGADGKLHMLAIAGDRSTTTSYKRNEGMRKAVAEDKNVILDQVIYGDWNRAKAQEQSAWLYQRYPHTRLIWTGNDLMAFGAMESWRARGGKPGRDAFFSAINTSAEAFTALESGSLSALAGGHFIAGAFSLVMLYDYHHGKDFIDEGLELDRSMFILFTPEESRRFQSLFGAQNFDKLDFRKFSKVLHPAIKKYDFSFRQLLNQAEVRK